MNQELFFGLLIGGMFLSSVTLGQLQVGGQNEKATDPAITYAQTARELLNQTKTEYDKGNSTGAEELATKAYLDNFEYVEPALEQKDARDLKEQIEGMMREDLRDMIRDNASIEEVGSHINATDAKLMEATSILNETRK
jgi:hypothetical protein